MLLARLSLSVVLSASIAAPRSAGAQDPSALAGCFQFDSRYFRWFVHDTVTRRMTEFSSDTLRLLSEAHRSRAGWVVEPVPAIKDSLTRLRYGRFSRWSFAGDSIQVTWTSGLHGFSFRLGGRDTLTGTVLEVTDVVMLDSNGRRLPGPRPQPAGARRIVCP